VTVWQIPDAVDTVVCAPDDGWKYHPKHIEQFPDIDKLCNVASCWIYVYIGILLGARPILHISRLKVNILVLLLCHHIWLVFVCPSAFCVSFWLRFGGVRWSREFVVLYKESEASLVSEVLLKWVKHYYWGVLIISRMFRGIGFIMSRSHLLK
jgi:hypothetical protein